LLPKGTLRAKPGLAAAIVVLGLINFSFCAVEAFLPLALTEVRHVGAELIAAALTAGTLAWTCGSWLQARTVDRIPRRVLLRSGLGFLLAGIGCVSSVLSPIMPPALAVVGWGVTGLGMGLAYQVSTLAVLEGAPAGREGEVTATMQMVNSLAVAVGTGLGGDFLARASHSGREVAWGISAVDVAALAACGLALVAANGIPTIRKAAVDVGGGDMPAAG
jgi:MFS family permease